MSTLLHRLGALAYRRPWAFVLTWLIVLGSVLGLAVTSDGHISSSMTIDGTPSQRVLDQLREELPAASGGQGTIVFTVPEGESLDTSRRASAIADAATEIAALPEVVDRSTFTADAADGPAPTTTPPDSARGEEPAGMPATRPLTPDRSWSTAHPSRASWSPLTVASRCSRCSSPPRSTPCPTGRPRMWSTSPRPRSPAPG